MSQTVAPDAPSENRAAQNSREVARGGYNPTEIEAKWQTYWAEKRLYHAFDDDPRPKFYNLTMFPYPSGELHLGHWFAFCGADVYGRWKRAQGYNVMQPFGYDAFGLPAENAAIKRGVQAAEWTFSNIERMTAQVKTMGTQFDWERQLATATPDYYKWNQFFFIQMYKKGLAYRKKAIANWCPNDQTTLANEQVLADGTCERCGAIVEKRELEQWFFKITAYADRLLDRSGLIDWPEKTLTMQRNWIGRSEGAQVAFRAIAASGSPAADAPADGYPLPVFTTRPDTIFGVTFFVIAPEHPLVAQITAPERKADVEAYVARAGKETEIERTNAEKEKTGVFTGAYAINPVTGERVPIWVADYVLMTYGTGAVMGVPAHDQRDFEFARKFDIPIKLVYQDAAHPADVATMTEAASHFGTVINSGEFDGLPDGKETIAVFIKHIESIGAGRGEVIYRLRDWLISRQRYWGTPIPMVYCPTDGIVPVPEEQLPVILPLDVTFKPSGESPLKSIPEFYNTMCPTCGGAATRETDTMDTFMDSSWYFLRYTDPNYHDFAFDPALVKKWMPVDQYTGGNEHAILHLLYVRFFTMALHDMGYLDFDEPFLRLYHQGLITIGGSKMSKRHGATTPDDLVREYGADTIRAYLSFLGPYSQGGEWTADGISGPERFLNRVWAITTTTAVQAGLTPGAPQPATSDDPTIARAISRARHKMVKKVTEDFANWQFNTALAAMMEFTNTLSKAAQEQGAPAAAPRAWRDALEVLLTCLAPIAPHITEELWQHYVGPATYCARYDDASATPDSDDVARVPSIHSQSWPTFDPAQTVDDIVTLVVQVNGKLRDRIEVAAGVDEATAKGLALSSDKVQGFLADKTPRQIIYVPGKLINIVI